MVSIADILAQKDIDEPSEVTSLRNLIEDDYGITPSIKVKPDALVLMMPNASLASVVRMRYKELEMRCQLTRKLYIRIG